MKNAKCRNSSQFIVHRGGWKSGKEKRNKFEIYNLQFAISQSDIGG